jgi:hypothetical protein
MLIKIILKIRKIKFIEIPILTLFFLHILVFYLTIDSFECYQIINAFLENNEVVSIVMLNNRNKVKTGNLENLQVFFRA